MSRSVLYRTDTNRVSGAEWRVTLMNEERSFSKTKYDEDVFEMGHTQVWGSHAVRSHGLPSAPFFCLHLVDMSHLRRRLWTAKWYGATAAAARPRGTCQGQMLASNVRRSFSSRVEALELPPATNG